MIAFVILQPSSVGNTHAPCDCSVLPDSSDYCSTVDGWSGGSNTATLNASAQKLAGAIKVGSNAKLTLSLTNGSSLEGSVDGRITNASGKTVSTEVGTVSVTLDGGSTWTLTGDSWVTEFHGDASDVISNGYTLYVNGTALTGTR